MEQIVRVSRTFPDGTAEVFHIRQSACSGDCHKCAGCGAARETMVLTAQNPIGAAPGDRVILRSDTGPVLKSAAVLYLCPLLLFFLGYLLGSVLWNRGGLTGCLAFALGIGAAVAYDRRVLAKKKTIYTITGLAGTSRPDSMNKGENGFD